MGVYDELMHEGKARLVMLLGALLKKKKKKKGGRSDEVLTLKVTPNTGVEYGPTMRRMAAQKRPPSAAALTAARRGWGGSGGTRTDPKTGQPVASARTKRAVDRSRAGFVRPGGQATWRQAASTEYEGPSLREKIKYLAELTIAEDDDDEKKAKIAKRHKDYDEQQKEIARFRKLGVQHYADRPPEGEATNQSENPSQKGRRPPRTSKPL